MGAPQKRDAEMQKNPAINILGTIETATPSTKRTFANPTLNQAGKRTQRTDYKIREIRENSKNP